MNAGGPGEPQTAYPSLQQRLLAPLERIKWFLWHGNQYRAVQIIESFVIDVDDLEVDYPNLGKFGRASQKFAVYIAANAGSLIERLVSLALFRRSLIPRP